MNSLASRAGIVALLIVAIGGIAGSMLRYGVELLVPSTLLATLAVNVLGCLALGFLLAANRLRDGIGQRHILVLGTGFLSSFTTFSTFVVDIVESAPRIALVYLCSSYALGFLAVLLGRSVAGRVVDRDPPGREDIDARNERLIKGVE
jgi:CrcB protein